MALPPLSDPAGLPPTPRATTVRGGGGGGGVFLGWGVQKNRFRDDLGGAGGLLDHMLAHFNPFLTRFWGPDSTCF